VNPADADAFGNAIGNSIVGEFALRDRTKSLLIDLGETVDRQNRAETYDFGNRSTPTP
jgi:hypothetical protein